MGDLGTTESCRETGLLGCQRRMALDQGEGGGCDRGEELTSLQLMSC